MEKRKKKRKAVRKYERKDTSVKNRRTAEIMKRKAKQVEFLNNRLPILRVEQKLVKLLHKIVQLVPNEDYRGDVRLAVLFDPLFKNVEPDNNKRMNRLRKIFRFRPTYRDSNWILMMYDEAKQWDSRGRSMGVKRGLIKD